MRVQPSSMPEIDVSVRAFIAECCSTWPSDRSVVSLLRLAHTRWALAKFNGRGLGGLQLPTLPAFVSELERLESVVRYNDGDGLACVGGVGLTIEAADRFDIRVLPAPRRAVQLKGGLDK